MSVTRYGIHRPDERIDDVVRANGVASFNDETEMFAEIFDLGDAVYVATWHDGVGLVIWYSAPSREEADHFVERMMAVQTVEATEVSS